MAQDRKRLWLLGALALGISAPVLAADGGPAGSLPPVPPPPSTSCDAETCLVVAGDLTATEEAATLAQILALRFAGGDVAVVLRGESDPPTPPSAGPTWVVHLSRIAQRTFLVAVDGQGVGQGDDVVREIQAGSSTRETAWTVASLVEQTVRPYLAGADSSAVGVGLAMIEPPEVGGTLPVDLPDTSYPRLRGVGFGLAATWLGSTGDVLAGPRATLAGTLGFRFVGHVSVGWLGIGEFGRDDVVGTVSFLPLALGIAWLPVVHQIVEVGLGGGFESCFVFYATNLSDGGPGRTDVVFSPRPFLRLDLVVHLSDALAVVAAAGGIVSLHQDVLTNDDVEIYRSDRFLPLMDLLLRLEL